MSILVFKHIEMISLLPVKGIKVESTGLILQAIKQTQYLDECLLAWKETGLFDAICESILLKGKSQKVSILFNTIKHNQEIFLYVIKTHIKSFSCLH